MLTGKSEQEDLLVRHRFSFNTPSTASLVQPTTPAHATRCHLAPVLFAHLDKFLQDLALAIMRRDECACPRIDVVCAKLAEEEAQSEIVLSATGYGD